MIGGGGEGSQRAADVPRHDLERLDVFTAARRECDARAVRFNLSRSRMVRDRSQGVTVKRPDANHTG